jgi:hypothetical protein
MGFQELALRTNCLHKLKSKARKSERKDGTPRTTIHSARTVNPHMREYRGVDEPRFTANNDARHDHSCSAYGRAKKAPGWQTSPDRSDSTD